MNRIKMAATILCLSLLAFACVPCVKADDWNKETKVTFSQPIEIPGGVVLPAGTYVFILVDSMANRHIVRIFNRDKSHLYATILAIPNYRLNATDKTVMTFGESATGVPQAIRAWFYPGANSGEEFAYPKNRAMELAKATNIPILAVPAELAATITKPTQAVTDDQLISLKEAPLTTVNPTGEEVAFAQTLPPLPSLLVPMLALTAQATPAPTAQAMSAPTAQATPAPPAVIINAQEPRNGYDRLPQTASLVPLIALLGLLSLGLGIALAFPQKTLSRLWPRA